MVPRLRLHSARRLPCGKASDAAQSLRRFRSERTLARSELDVRLLGLFHALLFLPRTLFGRKRKNTTVIAENAALPSLAELTRLVVTFITVTIGWVFFRAPTIGEAFAFLENCIVPAGTETFGFNGTPFLFIGMMLVVEWIQRRGSHALYRVFPFPRPVRWALYGLFLFFIFQNDGMQENFIYFKF